MLKINSVSPIAAGLLTLCFSLSAQTQARELPFPSFPASIETATYQGKKGCISDDSKYQFAVMKNEGLVPAGFHPLIEAPSIGVHIMSFVYNPEKGYGYTLANKNKGTQCIYNKLYDIKFKQELSSVPSSNFSKPSILPEDCDFDSKAINLCGSYDAVTTRLMKGGYEYNWQGDINSRYKLTMMTKGDQSFYLKTDRSSGATIITSVGKGKYEEFDIKKPWGSLKN